MGNAIRFALLLGGAFGAWGLWLAELLWMKGWAGVAWLSGFNWSAVPICALIVVTTSYFVCARSERTERLVFVGVACAISISAFAIARYAAFELFAGGFPGRASFAAASIALIVGVAASAGLALTANRWLTPLHLWAGILVAVGLLLVLPLSFATIKVFPAFNGSTDQIHSIKMGYPVFWTALLIPLALRLGRKSRPGPSTLVIPRSAT